MKQVTVLQEINQSHGPRLKTFTQLHQASAAGHRYELPGLGTKTLIYT